ACARLVEEIPTTLPGAIDPNVPTLLAKYAVVGLTHIALAHFDGNVFNVSGLNSRTGDSADKPPWVATESNPALVAEFASDGDTFGVGMRGGIWGPGEGVKSPQGQTVRERAGEN
ncbi:hypothetical protein GGX14DRAFT_367207, partial [Mycena pura]